VLHRDLHGDLLDLGIAHHGCDAGRLSIRVRHHPCLPEVLNVPDRAVPLHLELLAAPLEARVQFVEMVLGLLDVAFEPRDVRTRDATAFELGEGELLAIDERVERNLDVVAHDAVLLRALIGHLGQEWVERMLNEVNLDEIALG
jgi:hypothetical protein